MEGKEVLVFPYFPRCKNLELSVKRAAANDKRMCNHLGYLNINKISNGLQKIMLISVERHTYHRLNGKLNAWRSGSI